jgi:hypothetical protein
MKTMTRQQFEDVVAATMGSVYRDVDMDEEQLGKLVETFSATLTKQLLAQGFSLSWAMRPNTFRKTN